MLQQSCLNTVIETIIWRQRLLDLGR